MAGHSITYVDGGEISMVKPQADCVRVRLERRAGWTMPAATKKVARPSRWGNPWKIGYRSPQNISVIIDAEHACQLYEGMLEARREAGTLESFLAPLKGRNLACFCALDQPHCHAEVLLRWLACHRHPCPECGFEMSGPCHDFIGWCCAECGHSQPIDGMNEIIEDP